MFQENEEFSNNDKIACYLFCLINFLYNGCCIYFLFC